jgi:hypothetical protein
MAKVEDEPMPTLVFRSPRLEAAEWPKSIHTNMTMITIRPCRL